MKPGRVGCCVPFCRCSVPADRHPGATEIICAKHWRMVSRDLKARYRHLKRRRDKVWRLLYGRNIPKPGRGGLYIWACDAVDTHWERCKADAFERSAGI